MGIRSKGEGVDDKAKGGLAFFSVGGFFFFSLVKTEEHRERVEAKRREGE